MGASLRARGLGFGLGLFLGLGWLAVGCRAAYEYPDGPPICCTADDEGAGDCPCQATLSGSGDPAVVLVYLWIILGAALLVYHATRRLRQVDFESAALPLAELQECCSPTSFAACCADANPQRYERTNLAEDAEGGGAWGGVATSGDAVDAAAGASGTKPSGANPKGDAAGLAGMRYRGYRASHLGSIGYAYVKLTSLGVLLAFVALLIDTYNNCQAGTVDNQCFYGDLPITGDYYTNANIFFGLWCFGVVWFAFVFFYADDLPNWFRQPCPLLQAEYVCVWQPESDPENLSTSPTWPVRLARALAARFDKGERGSSQTLPVLFTSPCKLERTSMRYIIINCRRYFVQGDKLELPLLDRGEVTFGSMTASTYSRDGAPPPGRLTGLSEDEAELRMLKAGANAIPYDVDPAAKLLYDEFVTLVFFYQCMFYAWWFWDAYLITAAVEFSIVLGAAALAIVIKASNQRTIKTLAEMHVEATVVRDGSERRIDAAGIVPGDTLLVESAWTAPCDMVLLRGTAVANESGLTGESMPVAKAARRLDWTDGTVYRPEAHAKQTLFAGTTILQASPDAVAVCTRTGIQTSKGELISLILKPPKMTFKYDEEFVVIFALLSVYSAILFVASMGIQIYNGTTSYWVVRTAYGFFTVSQVLSPLLPVSLQVGQTMSARRLIKQGVFCVNPKRIAICGKVRVACFDKTGTITKEGLDFVGVEVVGTGKAGGDAPVVPFDPNARALGKTFLRGLASCHALTKYGAQLVGNEVEVRMFEGCGWTLEELQGGNIRVQNSSTTDTKEDRRGDALEVVRRFEFDHARMSMSVVVRDAGGEAYSFVKGAPEAIARMCTRDENGTVSRMLAKARAAAQDGCYVLAMGFKELGNAFDDELAAMSRDASEEALSILGLVLFRNELKADSRSAMLQLKAGDVRPVMITGDNAENGLYVSRESAMIGPNAAIVIGDLGPNGGVQWRLMNPKNKGDAAAGHQTMTPFEVDASNSPMHDLDGAAESRTGDDASRHPNLPPAFKLPCTTDDLIKAVVATTGSGGFTQVAPERRPSREWLREDGDGGEGAVDNCLPMERLKVEFALTGRAYEYMEDHEREQLGSIYTGLRIFARTSPIAKQRIIRRFMAMGLVVTMCGDGGNDCGALRTAHAGIALSEAEASVVSPFTSRTKSIQSVVDLLREGRCALATSFACFKFIILYGQLFSIVKMVILYYAVTPPAMDYLTVDVLVIITMSYAMTLSHPQAALRPERPTSSLLGPQSLASTVGVFAIYVCMISAAIATMAAEPGYIKFPYHCGDGNQWWTMGDNWESTVIFMCFIMMLAHSAYVYTFGGAYREPIYSNYLITALYVAIELMFTVVLLAEPSEFTDVWHIASRNFNANGTSSNSWQNYQRAYRGDPEVLAEFPDCEGGPPTEDYNMTASLRWRIWTLIVTSFVLTILWEKLVIAGPVRKRLRQRFPKKSVALRV